MGDVIEVNQLKDQQLDWCAQQKMLSEVSGNQSINIFRKRAAVMGFRAGCLLYLLDGKKLTDEAMAFAHWVSEYVLYFQLKYFGEKMEVSIEENALLMQTPVFVKNSNAWIFNGLPEVFTYLNVEAAYLEMGRKATGYRTVVKRWIKNGWIEKVDKMRFCKTAIGLSLLNRQLTVGS